MISEPTGKIKIKKYKAERVIADHRLETTLATIRAMNGESTQKINRRTSNME